MTNSIGSSAPTLDTLLEGNLTSGELTKFLSDKAMVGAIAGFNGHEVFYHNNRVEDLNGQKVKWGLNTGIVEAIGSNPVTYFGSIKRLGKINGSRLEYAHHIPYDEAHRSSILRSLNGSAVLVDEKGKPVMINSQRVTYSPDGRIIGLNGHEVRYNKKGGVTGINGYRVTYRRGERPSSSTIILLAALFPNAPPPEKPILA